MRAKRKGRYILTPAQNRLLKESLKQLLGLGLVQTCPVKTYTEERSAFLKMALNSKILDSELLS